MEDEYAGKTVLGMAAHSAEMSVGWEGRCSVPPEPVCIPGSNSEPWDSNGRGEGPQLQLSPLCPAPEHPQTQGFGSIFRREDGNQEQSGARDEEREWLSDEICTRASS